jgi:hypothetical protein
VQDEIGVTIERYLKNLAGSRGLMSCKLRVGYGSIIMQLRA